MGFAVDFDRFNTVWVRAHRAGVLVQATREKFTEYIALMKTALKDAAEASAAHSAGIQLHPPPPGATAEDHPTPGMSCSSRLMCHVHDCTCCCLTAVAVPLESLTDSLMGYL